MDASAVAVIAIAVLVFLALAVLLIVLAVVEIARVYGQRAAVGNEASHRLWWALAMFTGACVVGAGLMTDPDTFAIGLLAVSWSFCLFVLAVMIIDRLEREAEERALANQPELTLSNVLRPWALDGEAHDSPVVEPDRYDVMAEVG